MKAMHVCLSLFLLFSCNYVGYTPKTKTQWLQARPNPLVFDRMVDFRIEQMGWSTSRTDFMSKGKKYYEVFEHFPYMTTEFKVIDSNRMTFYFSEYIEEEKYKTRNDKVDLNTYKGYFKFYKENDKFLWKIFMK